MDATSTTEPFAFAAARPQATAASQRDDEALLRETRREIAGLVREAAELARQPISAEQFFPRLARLVAQAMAAEGVWVWNLATPAVTDQDPRPGWDAIAKVGRRVDEDRGLLSSACHARLLAEVAEGGQPVVVPPTPDAQSAESTVVANPLAVPVAVVPIGVLEDEPAKVLLEVLLDPEGGPATQRGYLRFAAQMGDLAGEFLRAEQIRRARENQHRWQQLGAVLPQLHAELDPQRVQVAIVDRAADLFQVARVGLCKQNEASEARLIAVSHVEAWDRHAPECRRIEQAAARWPLGSQSPRCYDDALDVGDSSPELPDAPEASASTEPSEEVDAGLQVSAVVRCGETKLVLVFQTLEAVDWTAEVRDDVQRFAAHAGSAYANAAAVGRIPWGRAALAWLPESTRRPRLRRGILLLALMAAVGLVAMVPTPLKVTARASLLPRAAQRVFAPRTGRIVEVAVRHGQVVQPGMLLVRMIDRGLDEEQERLVGRRAVLLEQIAESRETLADANTRPRDDRVQLAAKRQIFEEELRAVDRQLSIVRQQQAELDLRADRAGIVDGWQIEQTLPNRPVAAGHLLLQVIEPEAGWDVEAFVPQTRIEHVLEALKTAPTSARLVLEAHPDQPLDAKLLRVGPPQLRQADEGRVGRMLFELPAQDLPPVQTGTPGTVAIDCGKRPLGYVLFQDLIRTVRGALGMYL